MKKRIKEILENRFPEEDNYDSYASLRVATAAQVGEDISNRVYQTLKKEPKFGQKSLQDKRLKDIKDIMEGSYLETKKDRVMRQKSLLGFIDENNPAILKNYHFEIYNYCNKTSPNNRSLHEKEMKDIAWSLLQKSTLPQCLVVIRNYSYEHIRYRPLYYTFGQIYYFEDNQLLEKYVLDSIHELYYPENIDNIREDEKLKLKKLALRLYVKNHLYLNGDHLLVLFASRPNNPKILRYLIRLAKKLNLDLTQVIHNCLRRAIKNESLSNVKGILRECRETARYFDFGAILVNLYSLFSTGTLNTASPLIDICMLFCEYENKIKNEFDSAFNILEKSNEEKGRKLLHTKRQIVALVLIEIFRKKNFYQDERCFYNRLTNLLNNSLSGNKYLSVEFYRRNIDIFKYADIEKIKSLHYYDTIFQDKNNLKTAYEVFKVFKSRDVLPFWYNSINIETASLMDGTASLEHDNAANILSVIANQFAEIIALFIPKVNSLQVMEYLIPSLFEKIVAKMQRLSSYSTLENKKNTVSTRSFNVRPQKPGSSDCGYWTLLYAFNFLLDVCNPYSQPLPISLWKDLTNQFLQFKALVKNILSNRNEDLTAVDLNNIMTCATAGSEAKLVELFPGLHKQLSMMNENAGIPAYTIIHSLTAAEESKLEKSSIFGGCLPNDKMRAARNLYVLSQPCDEPRLHIIFFGTQGHWHVQILAISYFTPGSITFYRVDSDPAALSAETMQLINLHLQDLLDNPEAYAKNVAEEVIPPIHQDLIEFEKILQTSPLQVANRKEIIYKHCELLNNFFSTFGKLPLAKEYFPVLSLAKRIAQKLSKEYSDFMALSHQFSTLHQLSQQEKSSHIRIFPGNTVKSLSNESTHSAPVFQ